MATRIEIQPVTTYVNPANAIKAVEKVIAPDVLPELRYFIAIHTDGRCFPVFVGVKCMEHGVHFKFNVIA